LFKLLQEDNRNVLKANCSNHILHNATKHASDGLDVDIEMIILRNKQIYVPNLIKTLGFVLSIPGSNAHIERVFSLMSNKWTDQRHQSSLELIKSELMVAINYVYSCKEFFKFVQEDKKMLSSAASVDKYI
jgi:hypothetical protein